MPLVGKLLVPFSSAAGEVALPDGPEQEEALRKSKEISQQIGKQYNITPHLTGSLATGLNLPGKYDYDYGVNVRSPERFHKLVSQLEKSDVFKASPYNKPGTDMHIFQGDIGGTPVDLALLYGDKGKARLEATRRISAELAADPERRLSLLKQKAAIKDLLPRVPVYGDKLVKVMKRQIDEEIGMPRFGRDVFPQDQLKVAYELNESELKRLERENVFGHRTGNLDPVIQSGKLLSAAQAAKAGLLKSVELPGANRGNRMDVQQASTPLELRNQVYMTKGILPATSDYGSYGVLFEKKKAIPSPYLNTIPSEHLHEGDWRSKLTYVVPDHEYDDWQKKFPDRPIIRESQIPKSKMLPEKAGLYEIAGRLLSGPALSQKKELVQLKTAEVEKDAVLSHLLAGPVGHFLVNAAGRAAHHGSNLAEFMAHKGFQHGAGGSQIATLAKRSLHAIAGPEATATYTMAHNLGKHLYGLAPEAREATMKALAAGSKIDHPALASIQNSPVLGDLLKAIQHDVAGTAPTLQAQGGMAKAYSKLVDVLSRPTTSQFDSTGRRVVQNVVGAVPAAAMLAADPVGSAAHFGVNTAREALARSPIGKMVMDRNLKKGLEGKPISRLAELATDIGASPAFLDPYRMGKALHESGVGTVAREHLGDMPVTELPNVIRGAIKQVKEAPTRAIEHLSSLAAPGAGAAHTPAAVQGVQGALQKVGGTTYSSPFLKIAELAEDGEHKLQGHLTFQGLRVAVENRKGSVRSGTTPDGHKWRTVMKAGPEDLSKLAVSPEWAKTKVLSALRKGVTLNVHEKTAASVDELVSGSGRLKNVEVVPMPTSPTSAAGGRSLPNGTIIVPPEGSYESLQKKLQVLGRPQLPALSRDGERAFNAQVLLHEQMERNRRHVGESWQRHRPGVLLDEHNMLARMTGPGSEEVRSLVTQLRNTPRPNTPMADIPAVTQLMERLGVKGFQYGHGQRIPKAMKKQLITMMKSAEKAEDGEHKLQGHINFQGLPIAVENRKGSVRSGVDKDGHEWRTKMKAPYGYFEMPAKGKDGESIDVYVGPDKKALSAYVVHQHKADGKGHDEDKVIVGVKDIEQAKKLYLQHYDDPKFLGPISEVPVEELKKKLETKDRIEKISGAYFEFVKSAEDTVSQGDVSASSPLITDGGSGLHLEDGDDGEKSVSMGYAKATVKPAGDKAMSIEKLWVDPEHRGKGDARKLLEGIKSHFDGFNLHIKPRPFGDMPAPVDVLKEFYKSVGFRPVDKQDNMILSAST